MIDLLVMRPPNSRRGKAADPLAGYSSDWRKKRAQSATPDTGGDLDLSGGASHDDDPLSGYKADWKKPQISEATRKIGEDALKPGGSVAFDRRSETTALSSEEEPAFRQWAKMHGIGDVDHPDAHYDYRGAFKAGVAPEGGHWPDTFKQRGHPTFSNESQYSKGPGDGGHWDGETFIPERKPLAERHSTVAQRDALPKRLEDERASPIDEIVRGVKDLNPKDAPPPTTTLGKVADAAGRMAAHPVETAKGVVTAPLEAGFKLGEYTRQEIAKESGRKRGEVQDGKDIVTPGKDVVSKREALAAGAQLAALGAAEPATGILGRILAKPIGSRAAAIAAHAATGAGVGATFTPDDPAVGGILGAIAGGAHATVEGARAPGVRRVAVEGADLGEHPDRLLDRPVGKRPPPRPERPTARMAEEPTTTEPDSRYSVEMDAQPLLDRIRAAKAATAPKPPVVTTESVAVQKPAATKPAPIDAKNAVEGLYGVDSETFAKQVRDWGLAPDAEAALKKEHGELHELAKANKDLGRPLDETTQRGLDSLDQLFGKRHSFSSTQLDLPEEHAKPIREMAARIPDEHLGENGREEAPHVTVKYGLHTEDAGKVRELLQDQPPITVRFGKTSTFPPSKGSDGDEVVKVDVDSPELHALNKKIADALEHTDSFPDFKPHATVAYVKPGMSKQYVGDATMEGKTMRVDRLTFSSKNGEKVEIPFGGANAGESVQQPAVNDTDLARMQRGQMPVDPALRSQVEGIADYKKRQAAFEMTADDIVGHAEAKKIPVAESVTRLRNAGYTISDELAREAQKSVMRVDAPAGSGAPVAGPSNPVTPAHLEAAADRMFEVAAKEHAGSGDTSDDGLGVCTNCAQHIVDEFGGAVVGYHTDSNPKAALGQVEAGHDFAVTGEGRFIVDPWAKHTVGETERATLDLSVPADRAEALRLYGDPAKWEHAAGDKKMLAKVRALLKPKRQPTAKAPVPVGTGILDQIEPKKARTASGRLIGNLKTVATNELLDELERAYVENNKDGAKIVPTVSGEANMSHYAGNLVHHVGMKGGAVAASGRVAQRKKTIEKIESVLRERGIPDSVLHDRLAKASDTDIERLGMADEGADGTDLDYFNFDKMKPTAPSAEKTAPEKPKRYVPEGVDLEEAANMPVMQGLDPAVDTPMVRAARVYTVEHQPATIEKQSPERLALRQVVLDDEIDRITGEAVQRGGLRRTKEMGMVLGLPGSGKSTNAVLPLADHLQAAVSDVDDVKAALPEYEQGWGSELVYREAGVITRKIRTQLQADGTNYIHPGIGGNPDDYWKALDELAGKGYKVHLVRVRVSPEAAKQRVVQRFEEGGHFVRPEYIDSVKDSDAATYELLKGHPAVASYALIDHERVGKPVVVEERGADWISGVVPRRGNDGARPEADSRELLSDSGSGGQPDRGRPKVGADPLEQYAPDWREKTKTEPAESGLAASEPPVSEDREVVSSDGGGRSRKARPAAEAPKADANAVKPDAPEITTAARDVNVFKDAFQKIFAPARRSPQATEMAHLVRASNAEMAQRNEQARESLKKFSKALGKMKQEDQLDFINRMETGQEQKTPVLTAAAKAIRQVLDEGRDEIRALGKGKLEQYIENYFPHIWADPEKAKTIIGTMLGKRPLEGSKSFLKQRSIPTTADGIKLGLEPVTYNPVDLALIKLREMNRYLFGQRIWQEAKKVGLVKYIPSEMFGPAGYTRITDPSAFVYGSSQVPHWESRDEIVHQKLAKIIDDLGVSHVRTPKVGPALGYAHGDRLIETRFGGDLGTVIHELGHILDVRFRLKQRFNQEIGAAPKRTVGKGKNAGKEVPDYSKDSPEARARRKTLREELRLLANLRRETIEGVPDSKHVDRAYLHSWPEKAANLLEAYIRVPERFKQVAPGIYEIYHRIIASEPKLKPLMDVKPTLARSTGTATTDVGGIVVKGQYWAPEPVAHVMNAYLSPGLRGRNPYFDAYMGVGNTLNQAQLGLSAFHLGFTSIDAAVSQVALGLKQIETATRGRSRNVTPGARGRMLRDGVLRIAGFPVAPIATVIRGNRLIKSYLSDVQRSPELEALVQAAIQGGSRVRMDTFYQNDAIKKWLDSFRQRKPLGTIGYAIPALLEASVKPVLEYVVPRQKMGVFAAMAQYELERLGPDATVQEVRKAMGDAWDSVDNRLGQLVYDNLFWHRATKDWAMASVRAVGWNLGTLREVGGGIADAAKTAKGAVKGEDVEMSHRMSYIPALLLVSMILGAVVHYLFTGKRPETMKDYFFPKTGRKNADGNDERVQLPTYMKDIASYAKHPVQTIEHKMHPLLAAVAEMLHNKDYFGDEIRNEDDPLVTQVKQVVDNLILKQAIPFSVQNAMEEKQRRQGTAEKVGGFFGLTAASREIVRTPAQNKMAEILAKRGHPSRTPEQQDAGEERRGLLNQIRAKEVGRDSVRTLERAGELTRGQGSYMRRAARTPSLLLRFRMLTPKEASAVYQLGNDEEKALWRRDLRIKLRKARISTDSILQ